MLVLATITAPPARSRCTTAASAVAGGALASTLEPARVGSPATSNKSLTETMLPSSGPSESPAASRASAPSAALRATRVYTVRQVRAPSPAGSAIRERHSSSCSRDARLRTGAGACAGGETACGGVAGWALTGEKDDAVATQTAAPANSSRRPSPFDVTRSIFPPPVRFEMLRYPVTWFGFQII